MELTMSDSILVNNRFNSNFFCQSPIKNVHNLFNPMFLVVKKVFSQFILGTCTEHFVYLSFSALHVRGLAGCEILKNYATN